VTENNIVLCSMVLKYIVRSTKQRSSKQLHSLVWVLSFDSFLLMIIAFAFSSHHRLHVMLVRSNLWCCSCVTPAQTQLSSCSTIINRWSQLAYSCQVQCLNCPAHSRLLTYFCTSMPASVKQCQLRETLHSRHMKAYQTQSNLTT